MIIHTPLNQVKDQLLNFISEGFSLLGNGFTNRHDDTLNQRFLDWSLRVVNYLDNSFPSKKESGQFLYTPGTSLHYGDMSEEVQNVINSTERRIKVLESILEKLSDYYQFELDAKRLFIQSIDSFSKARNVNSEQVRGQVHNGFLDLPEQRIKEAFLQIIGQSYIPNDWGGESEDIYSSFILLNGERVQTSIVLKGNGTVRGNETHLGDLGANGDQLERMMRTGSSKLYIIQSVKPIGQDIINSAEAFIDQQRSRGNHCYYCAVDGQDTAMLMMAYGLLSS